jgi:uncharacterized protein with HEPN domain
VRGRSVRLYVIDMLRAIEKIERFTEGFDLASFSSSELVVDAVLRNLEVLGEAARNVPEEMREAHPNIPWGKIVGLRNIVAHAYFGVDLENVWKIVQENVPEVRSSVVALVKELENGS